jgi:hypothetical protein
LTVVLAIKNKHSDQRGDTPLLERLKKTAISVARSATVFHIHDAKRALKAACERLGYPNFSQRNIRQCLIVRLWKAGVDKS